MSVEWCIAALSVEAWNTVLFEEADKSGEG